MEAKLSLRLQYLPCRASTVSGVCLTASTVTVTSRMLQIKPSPGLLQGSKVELHPLAHAQFATFNSVQRLSPKKGASDKNSRTVWLVIFARDLFSRLSRVEPFAKIKTAKFLLSTCKASEPRFNLATLNYPS